LAIIRTASPAVTSAPPLLRRQTRSNCAGAIPRETSARELTAAPGGTTICDPISFALGTAASVGGGLWSRSDQLSNAQREANARNGVLSTAINGLNQDYSNINAPAFSGAVGGIPTAGSLKGAQDARTGTVLGNVKGPATLTSGPSDAPPALAKTSAANMKNATDFIQDQGTATGNLGGYGDSWFNSGLNEQDAARKIGIGNLFANETKSLLPGEQDLAGAAAYKTPSPLSSALQGLGSMLGSYSGRGGNRRSSGNAQPQYYPSGSGGDSLDWG
jgi:hypothetical protein